MKNIFSDTAKFKSILAGTLKVTITREKPLQNFLFSLKEDNAIDEETYERLDPSSSQVFSTVYLRCTMLTFRPYPSFLPLVHIPTTSLNFLFQNLSYLLTSLTLFQIHFLSLKIFRNSNFHSNNAFMPSFDVNSLFTNVPWTR